MSLVLLSALILASNAGVTVADAKPITVTKHVAKC